MITWKHSLQENSSVPWVRERTQHMDDMNLEIRLIGPFFKINQDKILSINWETVFLKVKGAKKKKKKRFMRLEPKKWEAKLRYYSNSSKLKSKEPTTFSLDQFVLHCLKGTFLWGARLHSWSNNPSFRFTPSL